MQIKDQWKRPRDWKVVAGVGAVAALGITGLVIANPADGSVPASISLEERARIAETRIGQPIPPIEDVIDLSRFGDDLSSPFDDDSPGIADTGGDDSADGAASADAPAPPPSSSAADGSPPPGGGDDSGDDGAPSRGGGGGGGGGGDDSG
ncbi:MAG: hypothetical protein M3349_00050, partial [Actinomycetota bacterium]|nr:hypothetical protein [Actinomycetota bacterium]